MWKSWAKTALILVLYVFSAINTNAAGNQWNDSFNTAKRTHGAMYTVDAWEYIRDKRIETIQGNKNPAVKVSCQAAGLW